MKILITAGGTTEKIDQVRAITNHSTGRLGQALADYLAANPDTTIDYVTTKQAAVVCLAMDFRQIICENKISFVIYQTIFCDCQKRFLWYIY